MEGLGSGRCLRRIGHRRPGKPIVPMSSGDVSLPVWEWLARAMFSVRSRHTVCCAQNWEGE